MSARRKVQIGAGVVLVAALLAEIGLRVTLGLGTPPLLQADSTIGYLFQADQDIARFGHRVHINNVHQRSEPLSNRPDSSLLRVLFLGDSVTWGGVLVDQPDTYPEGVEARMDAACDLPVEALNASAGSWGIGNLKAYMERFGTFESDVVVLQVGSHDLLQEASDASPVGTHPAFPTENPWLATQELVTRYLWPRYVQPLFTDPEPAPATPGSSVQAAQFARNMNVLGDLIQMIQAAEAQPLLLHTPDRNEVVAGDDGRYASTYAAYRPRFLALADSLGVPVVNLHQRWRGGRRAGVLPGRSTSEHAWESGSRPPNPGADGRLGRRVHLRSVNIAREAVHFDRS
jgi:lysophospholipase L1-like esterase